MSKSVLNTQSTSNRPKFNLQGPIEEALSNIQNSAGYQHLYILADFFTLSQPFCVVERQGLFPGVFNTSYKNDYVIKISLAAEVSKDSGAANFHTASGSLSLINRGVLIKIDSITVVVDPKKANAQNEYRGEIYRLSVENNKQSSNARYKIKDAFLTGLKQHTIDISTPHTIQEQILRIIYNHEMEEQATLNITVENMVQRFNSSKYDQEMFSIFLKYKSYFTESHFITLQSAIHRSQSLCLLGPPGVGKTRMAEIIGEMHAAKHKHHPNIVMASCHHGMDERSLIGSTIMENGAYTFFLGSLLRERENVTVVLDEYSRGSSEALDKFLGILSIPRDKNTLFDIVTPALTIKVGWATEQNVAKYPQIDCASHQVYLLAPSWNVVITSNTSDKVLVSQLSSALMRRLNILEVNYPGVETKEDLINLDCTIRGFVKEAYAKKENDQNKTVQKSILEKEENNLVEAVKRLMIYCNSEGSEPVGLGFGHVLSFIEAFAAAPNYVSSSGMENIKMKAVFEGTLMPLFIHCRDMLKHEYINDKGTLDAVIKRCLKELGV